jgi:hypothetical protein
MCGDFKHRSMRYKWYNLYKHGHTPICHLGGTASPNSASKGAVVCWINMGIFLSLSLSACTRWNSTTNGSKPNIRAMVYQCLSKIPQWKLQYLIFAIATEILPTGQSSTDWLFSIEKGQITGPDPVFRHTLPESWSTQKQQREICQPVIKFQDSPWRIYWIREIHVQPQCGKCGKSRGNGMDVPD